MKVAVCLLAFIGAVLAEPPLPSSRYLPASNRVPSSNYGAPSGTFGANGFGNGGGTPTSQYGAPSSQYGAPRQPSSQYGAPNGGYDDQSMPANYHFEYAVKDAESGNDFGHEESRQGDVAKGRYYVLLPDGRKQTVEYIADNDGYRPMVTYDETQGGYPRGGYPKQNGNGNDGYRY